MIAGLDWRAFRQLHDTEQLLKSGVLATLRFLFAFLPSLEWNRD